MFWKKKKKAYKTKLLSALMHQLAQAQKSKAPFGIFVLQVPIDLSRSIVKELPGRVVGYQKFAKTGRYIGLLAAQTDEGVLTARKKIYQLARKNRWGEVAVGLARWPVDGSAIKELLAWASFDVQRQVKAVRADKFFQQSTESAADADESKPLEPSPAGSVPVEKHSPLGQSLVKRGIMSEEQLNHALRVQRLRHSSFGGLALQEGLLTESHVVQILGPQEQSGSLFGETALRLGYLTADQVVYLLEIQRGNLPPLGQVIQQLGYVSAEKLAETIDDMSRIETGARV